ncbi:MAG TPA: metal-sulfur cluster assembly factor [Candidatus Thermoplasmatota archaeon]|nr:metal-sulfur cluster assembly factor [Candidatus Thermoplasmatota archaeon]
MATREDVLAALKEVYDPEIPINIVDLGLIYRVDFPAEEKVEIDMTLTGMGCPVGPAMVEQVKATALMVPGIREADVNLVWRPPWDPKKATEDGKIMLSAMGVRVD